MLCFDEVLEEGTLVGGVFWKKETTTSGAKFRPKSTPQDDSLPFTTFERIANIENERSFFLRTTLYCISITL